MGTLPEVRTKVIYHAKTDSIGVVMDDSLYWSNKLTINFGEYICEYHFEYVDMRKINKEFYVIGIIE